VDCSALTQAVLGELGASLPRTVRAQQRAGRSIPVKKLAAGDLIFFRLDSSRVNHVGIALDSNRFIHASSSRGVVIDYLMDAYFHRRIVEARRVFAD
jgi:cell wall-associated NlpC family hydrolase